ncbi:hypothetical protein I5Q16_16300 [Serratia marcescens]|nr:hypothetical protein [Serratia marcescens]
MTDNIKKVAGMATANKSATFMLDDRSIASQLDAFRQYCQRLPYQSHESHELYESHETPVWPEQLNWAQVFLGYEAGAWTPEPLSETAWRQAGEAAWAFERERLVKMYETPALADGQLPPERAFVLAMLGMLEVPRALLNALPAQHRSLYYHNMLALEARSARADRVTVHFSLTDEARELVLPAGFVLDAGQDDASNALHYALAQPVTVNAAKMTDLRWVVRDPYVSGGKRARIILNEETGQQWPAEGVKMFGIAPANVGKPPRADADRPVESGRIVESVVLAVAGGERTWRVVFNNAIPPQETLRAAISIEDAWVPLSCDTEIQGGTTWVLTLPATAGIPTAVNALDGLTSEAPLLKLTSQRGTLVPEVMSLHVTVKHAVGVLCTNDEGTALSAGGFPFGDAPKIGDGVNLMSPDWLRLGPKLKQVTVTPHWSGVPDHSFKEWYGPDSTQKTAHWLLLDENLTVTTDKNKGKTPGKLDSFKSDCLAKRVKNGHEIDALITADRGYPNVTFKKDAPNGYFSVMAGMRKRGEWPNTPSGQPLALFGGITAPEGQSLVMSIDAPGTASAIPDEEDPTRWPWHLRLQLTTSFLHDDYAAHVRMPSQTVSFLSAHTTTYYVPDTMPVSENAHETAQMYRMVEQNVNGKQIPMPAMKKENVTMITPTTVIVPKAKWNPPYTPQWSGVRIDYQASDDQVSQRLILPFGYASSVQANTDMAADADVYIGIQGIDAGQQLTLHWQLRSPGAMPLEWQYLARGENWAPLSVCDGTGGWRESGIWSIDWPEDAIQTATCLPPGRMWLRGRLPSLPVTDGSADGLPTTPYLIGCVTNAAQAELLVPQRVLATHFKTGLPAGSITQALEAPEALQSVSQPWCSAGGVAAETAAAFAARVASRLRHRERGLNSIDLTMLLHERHESICELLVLPSKRGESGALQQTIVVMPGSTLSDSEDRRRPALSPSHLVAMAQELQAITSPWLALTCVNPSYIPVKVSWDVAYIAGLSQTMGDTRVKAALEAAFMPWLQEANERGVRVIGRSVTHDAVRDVLYRMPEIASINEVYLNGDKAGTPSINADEVALLTCIPLNYTGLTLFCGDEKNAEKKAVLFSGEPLFMWVCPPILSELSLETDNTKNDVYWVDLDTGRRLSTDSMGGESLWVTTLDDPLQFMVTTEKGACGIFRLGIVIKQKNAGSEQVWQSAVIEEYLTLYVTPPPF